MVNGSDAFKIEDSFHLLMFAHLGGSLWCEREENVKNLKKPKAKALEKFPAHIVLIQSLGYEKIAGKIQICCENAHKKRFETSHHLIYLALSRNILMAQP